MRNGKCNLQNASSKSKRVSVKRKHDKHMQNANAAYGGRNADASSECEMQMQQENTECKRNTRTQHANTKRECKFKHDVRMHNS